MSDLDYLNQISADSRPVKAKSDFFIPKKLLFFLIGAVVLALAIIIIGSNVSSPKNKEYELVSTINYRSGNLIEIISTYNKKIKSSELRSMTSSLSSVLTATQSSLNTIITNEFADTEKENKTTDESVEESEETYMNNIIDTYLEPARLNGYLDRVYVSQLTYEISILMSLESKCEETTSKTSLKEALASSYSNLESLETQFENYSAD